MVLADQQAFQLGPFRLDRHSRSLTLDGVPVSVGGRALDILLVLAGAAGQTVSKATLLGQVWAGLTVEDNNLQVHISALRKTLGAGRIITVPRRGYRLLLQPEGRGIFESDTDPLPEWPDLPAKPSIAVLPFSNMSGDSDQEYFVDGMVEEITTALSRIRWLFVIARNSSFTYKGKYLDVRQVSRELGVHYVLEGSVRKAGQRVRITGQLIDAQSGMHLWADHFDGSLKDMFELQDRVAITVAGVIEPTLMAAEVHRTATRPTSDFTAYDLYLRALPLWGSYERDLLMQACDLLVRAVERDPQYGPALALAAQCHFQLDMHGWTEDRETNRRTGIRLARRALQGSPDDAEVLARAAFALGYFGEDVDVAIGLVDRALTLTPSCAMAWYWSGVLRNFVGQPEVALEHFSMFLRLSPRDRFPGYLIGIGIALFLRTNMRSLLPHYANLCKGCRISR